MPRSQILSITVVSAILRRKWRFIGQWSRLQGLEYLPGDMVTVRHPDERNNVSWMPIAPCLRLLMRADISESCLGLRPEGAGS